MSGPRTPGSSPWSCRCPAGTGTCPASTSTSASPPRTATRPSGPTRSPRPADGTRVELTVERLEDGEVSPYLAGELREGDQLELRGPVGGYFVWEPDRGGPLLLVGGGSGVVPLMAMLRRRAAAGGRVPARLLYSSRTLEDVIYRQELERLEAAGDGLTVTHALTRAQPPGWSGYARRIDAVMLEEVGWPPGERPLAYVCGPTRLVEAVAGHLVALGHDPGRVRTERFGPTGVP